MKIISGKLVISPGLFEIAQNDFHYPTSRRPRHPWTDVQTVILLEACHQAALGAPRSPGREMWGSWAGGGAVQRRAHTHLRWPAQPAAGPRSAAAPPGSARSAAHRSGTSAGPCPPPSPRSHTAPWWPLPAGGRGPLRQASPGLGGTLGRAPRSPATPMSFIHAQKFPA